MTGNSFKIQIRRALISAWRKEPAVELARGLREMGVSLVASGGTADAIAGAGMNVERLSERTGFNNLLGGRVKTLHPAVYAAILARRDSEGDLEDLSRSGIEPFDLVAVDLYPFPEAPSGIDEAVELIDIGGVSLLRAAAKNHRWVAALGSAEQFADFIAELRENDGELGLEHRRRLAVEAFRWVSLYDSRIAGGLGVAADPTALPELLDLHLVRKLNLRYGENPHQMAGFYVPVKADPEGIAAAKQFGGKQLSFNNLLDLDTAMRLPGEFDQPAAAILKHTTPCGVGIGGTILEAFLNAHSTDPQSAFGSIVGLNRVVDIETAQAIRKGFVEVVCAPGFDEDALKHLRKSKNLRNILFDGEPAENELDIRAVWGGMLVEKRTRGFPELDDLKTVTSREPTMEQLTALKFAWKAVRYVKSNAILIADDKRTIGIGAGQMSRVDAAHLAVWKAGQANLDTKGCVAASDAFFPFRDGMDVLADAGVTAIIQPGGSIRDEEVIKAADERNIVMVLTGRRHFRH